MASVRVDYFDSKGEKNDKTDDYHQTSVSPKFGLVYQPLLDKLSLFVNYMNGFVNVAPSQVADPDGSNPRTKSFKPEQADQFEFEIKMNLFSNKLSATFSYYDIKVSNRVTGDPDNFYNSDKVKVTVNMNNITDKEYYIGYWSVNPQKPGNIVASFAYKF